MLFPLLSAGSPKFSLHRGAMISSTTTRQMSERSKGVQYPP